MKTKITYKDVVSFGPCYMPEEIGITDKNAAMPIPEFIKTFRDKIDDKEDIIWVVCRKEYMSDRDMRLFAVWCAREALKLVEPDPRSVTACDVAERFANGEATTEELAAAWNASSAAEEAACAAWNASRYARYAANAAEEAASAAWNASSAAWNASRYARYAASAAWRASAVWNAAGYAAEYTFRDAQIDQLLTYFK